MLTVAVLRSWLPEQLPRAGNDLEDSGALLGRLAGDVGVAWRVRPGR